MGKLRKRLFAAKCHRSEEVKQSEQYSIPALIYVSEKI
jgi:hypothetical protein